MAWREYKFSPNAFQENSDFDLAGLTNKKLFFLSLINP
jgi:hypothetical protein